jgi:VWFA-related protein
MRSAPNAVERAVAVVMSLVVVTMASETGSSGHTQSSTTQLPRFSSGTDVVRVYATVKDKTGHLVTDLEPQDFEIRDRGKVVPLAVFSKEVLPITAAIIVDMTGFVFSLQTFELLRDGLSGFVEGLETHDRATIGWFSKEQIMPGPALTSDREVLKRFVMTDIRMEVAHPQIGNANVSFISVDTIRRPLWNAIGAAARSLATEPGRKVVVVLANGSNTHLLPGYPRLTDVKALIATDEFMVYAVHGFEPRLADLRMNRDDLPGTLEERQTSLQEITDLTGGGFIVAPFDAKRPAAGPRVRGTGLSGAESGYRHPLSLAFRSQLAGIVDELRHQYTLGFVPALRDGKVGKIEVRMKRPDLKVWARRTYLAPKE